MCLCIYLYRGMHVLAQVPMETKRELDPLLLKNRQFCLWVLGGEHRSSARAVHAFNYGAIYGPHRFSSNAQNESFTC